MKICQKTSEKNRRIGDLQHSRVTNPLVTSDTSGAAWSSMFTKIFLHLKGNSHGISKKVLNPGSLCPGLPGAVPLYACWPSLIIRRVLFCPQKDPILGNKLYTLYPNMKAM